MTRYCLHHSFLDLIYKGMYWGSHGPFTTVNRSLSFKWLTFVLAWWGQASQRTCLLKSYWCHKEMKSWLTQVNTIVMLCFGQRSGGTIRIVLPHLHLFKNAILSIRVYCLLACPPSQFLGPWVCIWQDSMESSRTYVTDFSSLSLFMWLDTKILVETQSMVPGSATGAETC